MVIRVSIASLHGLYCPTDYFIHSFLLDQDLLPRYQSWFRFMRSRKYLATMTYVSYTSQVLLVFEREKADGLNIRIRSASTP
jgi:hypothetical protein